MCISDERRFLGALAGALMHRGGSSVVVLPRSVCDLEASSRVSAVPTTGGSVLGATGVEIVDVAAPRGFGQRAPLALVSADAITAPLRLTTEGRRF